MRLSSAIPGLLHNFSTKSKAKSVPVDLRIINSHEVASDTEAALLANTRRIKEIKVYQRELARTRRSHASYAQSLPTKSKIQEEIKSARSQKRSDSWSRYVEGLKTCWNPPVAELQASGKIPRRDEVKRAEKASRGQGNLLKALKQSILMKRKYLNYLGSEIVPSLVTPENLDAKIQEAVDGPTGSSDFAVNDGSIHRPNAASVSYNVAAEAVVAGEQEVKRKLKEIRVPMNEFELGIKVE